MGGVGLVAVEEVELEAEGGVELEAEGGVELEAGGGAELEAGGGAELEAEEEVEEEPLGGSGRARWPSGRSGSSRRRQTCWCPSCPSPGDSRPPKATLGS